MGGRGGKGEGATAYDGKKALSFLPGSMTLKKEWTGFLVYLLTQG